MERKTKKRERDAKEEEVSRNRISASFFLLRFFLLFRESATFDAPSPPLSLALIRCTSRASSLELFLVFLSTLDSRNCSCEAIKRQGRGRKGTKREHAREAEEAKSIEKSE